MMVLLSSILEVGYIKHEGVSPHAMTIDELLAPDGEMKIAHWRKSPQDLYHKRAAEAFHVADSSWQ